MVEAVMVVRDQRIRVILSMEIIIEVSPWIRTNRVARSPYVCNRLPVSMKILLYGHWRISRRNTRCVPIQGW